MTQYTDRLHAELAAASRCPKVVASFDDHLSGLTYVLTRGDMTDDFERVKEYRDFAVYVGKSTDLTETIARHGDKISRERAAFLFGAFYGLTAEHFRR